MTPEEIQAVRCNPPVNLTIEEAAAYSTLSKRTLFNAIANGELRAQRVGRRRIIRRCDLDAWLNKRTVEMEGCYAN